MSLFIYDRLRAMPLGGRRLPHRLHCQLIISACPVSMRAHPLSTATAIIRCSPVHIELFEVGLGRTAIPDRILLYLKQLSLVHSGLSEKGVEGARNVVMRGPLETVQHSAGKGAGTD